MPKIKVSAFRWVPPFAQGLVRDLRVRWALEEAGLPYQELLIGPEDQRSTEYRGLQPFGQVPAFEEDGLVMFESGAIVMHIAERHAALMPTDPLGRARAKTWMFAALNTIEPQVQTLAEMDNFYPQGEEWVRLHRPAILDRVTQRLGVLEASLDGKDYLEDAFTAGDLLMATVLRLLRHTDILAPYQSLSGYLQRCQARPAFERALAAQLGAFERHQPPPRTN